MTNLINILYGGFCASVVFAAQRTGKGEKKNGPYLLQLLQKISGFSSLLALVSLILAFISSLSKYTIASQTRILFLTNSKTQSEKKSRCS